MAAELVRGAGLPEGQVRAVVGGASGGVVGTSSMTMSGKGGERGECEREEDGSVYGCVARF